MPGDETVSANSFKYIVLLEFCLTKPDELARCDCWQGSETVSKSDGFDGGRRVFDSPKDVPAASNTASIAVGDTAEGM